MSDESPRRPGGEVRQSDLLDLLREVQVLGARYYQATGKPLGVTGEVAEFEAADKLGLTLCGARTPWYDAVDATTGRKVQVKGRAVDRDDRYRGMCPAIRCGETFHDVALVLLDKANLHALEIWLADVEAVSARIAGLTSERRRKDGVLAISQFKSVARRAWPALAA